VHDMSQVLARQDVGQVVARRDQNQLQVLAR
jgi:hypothetical protein